MACVLRKMSPVAYQSPWSQYLALHRRKVWPMNFDLRKLIPVSKTKGPYAQNKRNSGNKAEQLDILLFIQTPRSRAQQTIGGEMREVSVVNVHW